MTGILIGLGLLGLVALAGFVMLSVRSRGDYQVLPTVVDDPTLPRVDLNGIAFHAEAHGTPGDPVILVLHGGPGGDYRSLLSLTDLADDHRVVFYDQRGAGLSQRVDDEQLTAATALGDLDAFVDRYSPDAPVTLIGHSWGAILAAGYLRHHPERVAAAVLAEPGYLDEAGYDAWQARYDELMSGWSYTRLAIEAGFEAQHVDGPDGHAGDDYLVGQRILPAFTSHPDNPYHRPGQPYDAPSWRWGKAAGDALSGETFTTSANAGPPFDGPILFVAGACNAWIGADLQADHAATYPNAELAVITDAGHDMFWDNPTETLAAVRTFLDSIANPATRPQRSSWLPGPAST